VQWAAPSTHPDRRGLIGYIVSYVKGLEVVERSADAVSCHAAAGSSSAASRRRWRHPR